MLKALSANGVSVTGVNSINGDANIWVVRGKTRWGWCKEAIQGYAVDGVQALRNLCPVSMYCFLYSISNWVVRGKTRCGNFWLCWHLLASKLPAVVMHTLL